MQMGHMASGTHTIGTADTAFNKSIGFAPDYVKVINVTSDYTFEWWSDMADLEAYKTTGSSGVDALITDKGISKYAGTSGGNAKGFTVGADAGMTNTANDVLYWIAWGRD